MDILNYIKVTYKFLNIKFICSVLVLVRDQHTGTQGAYFKVNMR